MSGIGLIVDVSVAVVVILLIVFGTWRGMYKLIYGLVSGLLAIVLAVLLAGTLTTFIVQKTELETQLNGAMNEAVLKALPAELEAENVHINFTEEGVSVVHSSGETFGTVKDYVAQKGGSFSAFAGMIDSLVTNGSVKENFATTAEDGTTTYASPTLADLFCVAATTYVLLAASFIALWIVGYIVIRLLMFLLKKLVTTTYVGHFLDKLIGFVIGAAIGMLIVWGALAVIRLLGTYTWIIPVNNVINSSTLTKFLYEHNYVYTFLVETMNLQDTISGIVGSFSGLGGN